MGCGMVYAKKSADLFPDDVLLRDCGFLIHDRPADDEAVWTRDGREYSVSAALAKARAERSAALNQLEMTFDGK